MSSPVLLLALVAVGVARRVAAAYDWSLVNYAPFTAVAFCGAAFLRSARGLAFAVAVLLLSDLWIDVHYASAHGHTWSFGAMLVRLGALAASTGLGLLAARRRTAAALWGGSVAATLLFFLLTNSAAWWADPFYARTAAGWWQALTIGHPEFPPTLHFLRNSLLGDLAFTGAAAVMAAPAEPRLALARRG